MGRRLGWMLGCVWLLACGGDDGTTGSGGGTGSDDAGPSSSADGGDDGSGGGSGDGSESADATSGASGACDANVMLALADNLGLGPMEVEAIRREFDTGDVLYLVQVFGSASGATRLDISFGGIPVADTTYEADGTPGTPMVPFVGLYPSGADSMVFVSGTVNYAQVATMNDEVLVMELDLQFQGGTVTGCIAQPITVEFSAPPDDG